MIVEVRFLGVIKDRQYQLDIVLASHRRAGDSDEAVALGGHVGRDKEECHEKEEECHEEEEECHEKEECHEEKEEECHIIVPERKVGAELRNTLREPEKRYNRWVKHVLVEYMWLVTRTVTVGRDVRCETGREGCERPHGVIKGPGASIIYQEGR
ncbi:hypothetical protein Pmani_036871 [Petrolisthes manimaculis]|uniref:Uncharacterized protein n=1 Tax=Petrolisthes manimaculis TaxID=1843537 RepID=A0AAE1NIM9_9EUCA|nr:hypothetical protein Pmani_036871 [Petrolisthes manimaculis]